MSKLTCPDCGGVLGPLEPGESGCTCFNSESVSAPTTGESLSDTQPLETLTKVCCKCGADVAGKKRYKDSRGYICADCNRKEIEEEKAGTALCPNCGRRVKETALTEFRGMKICKLCIAELKANDSKRIKVITGSQFEASDRKSLKILIIICIILLFFMILGFFKNALDKKLFLSRTMSLNWDFSTLADQLGHVIDSTEADLRLEQAVYGLDAKDEKTIQSLLADGLQNHFEVAREVHYPSSHGNKLTHRQRCDLVLTPKGRPLRLDSSPPTLFDPPNQASHTEALWIEVKIAYQFREGGERHGGYGPQFRQAVVADLRKMEAEPLIRDAGLLLVVFNESAEILAKDLELFEDILVRKEVLAGFRHVRSTAILDRIGHRVCTIALWPTIQR